MMAEFPSTAEGGLRQRQAAGACSRRAGGPVGGESRRACGRGRVGCASRVGRRAGSAAFLLRRGGRQVHPARGREARRAYPGAGCGRGRRKMPGKGARLVVAEAVRPDGPGRTRRCARRAAMLGVPMAYDEDERPYVVFDAVSLADCGDVYAGLSEDGRGCGDGCRGSAGASALFAPQAVGHSACPDAPCGGAVHVAEGSPRVSVEDFCEEAEETPKSLAGPRCPGGWRGLRPPQALPPRGKSVCRWLRVSGTASG